MKLLAISLPIACLLWLPMLRAQSPPPPPPSPQKLPERPPEPPLLVGQSPEANSSVNTDPSALSGTAHHPAQVAPAPVTVPTVPKKEFWNVRSLVDVGGEKIAASKAQTGS